MVEYPTGVCRGPVERCVMWKVVYLTRDNKMKFKRSKALMVSLRIFDAYIVSPQCVISREKNGGGGCDWGL
jgi:hypothetical protein